MTNSITSISGPYCYHTDLMIASGSFGSVYIGLKKEKKGELIAIKKFFDKRNKNDNDHANENEINALRAIQNKNVVQVYDFIYSNDNKDIYLILELSNYGTLEEYVENNSLSDLEIRCLFKKIAEGIRHIHNETGFLHRDIKPNNILFQDDEIKIADFGEARELKDGKATTFKGTSGYMSPQILVNSYTNKCDIFSLGVTLFFMYFKRTPWFKIGGAKIQNFETKYKEILVDKDIDSIFEDPGDSSVYISYSAKNLIKNMLQYDEEYRYDINQVMNHHYLKIENYCINTPKIRSPITSRETVRTFLYRNTFNSPEEKKYKNLFELEIEKQKIRDISERIYYEKEKISFIHFCLENVYKNGNEFQNKEMWYTLMIVLARMTAFKSEFFYRYLLKKKTRHFYLQDDWLLFYNSKNYSQVLSLMKKCNGLVTDNLNNLLKVLKKKKIEGVAKSLIDPNYRPNLSFFRIFQDIVVENLKYLMEKWKKGREMQKNNKMVLLIYDLILISNMNQSFLYSKERGFINFEKYNEDSRMVPSNIEVIKQRIKIFAERFNHIS